MIYKSLNENEFINEFVTAGHYANNFSKEGLKNLYGYLYEISDYLELDVIAICCEWSEYDSFDELIADYSQYTTLESIENETTVLELDSGGYIVRVF